MREAKLFNRRPFFYVSLAIILSVGLALSLLTITLTANIFIQTLNAFVLAIIFMQLGFIGHDIAHHQVFSSPVIDKWVGSFVYALGIGISLEHWHTCHDEHHKFTNQIGKDPDIELPLVFTEEQLELYSLRYRKYVLPFQHWYFFFFMPLAYFNYIINSLPWNPRILLQPIRLFEFILTIIHFAVLFYLVFTYLGLWLGLYFFFISAMVGGAYAGFSFAPNHKGQETISMDQEVTYRTQIISTRNIRPSVFADIALGGLNYQIEHHLFSYMPRPNLGRAQKIVKQFCKEQHLPYHETTFLGSVKEMFTALQYFAKATENIPNKTKSL